MLLKLLKNHFRESDSHFSPMIYILKILDPNYRLNKDSGKLEIISDLFAAEIRTRIDEKMPNLDCFFQMKKIAFTSTNEDIENLVDILTVEGVRVYVIDTDSYYNDIYAYKIDRTDRFF